MPQAHGDAQVEHVVLWKADTQAGPDGCHAGPDVVAQDRRNQPWVERATQDGPAGAGDSGQLQRKLRLPEQSTNVYRTALPRSKEVICSILQEEDDSEKIFITCLLWIKVD